MRLLHHNIKPLMPLTVLAGTALLLAGCQNYLVFSTNTKFGLDISQRADQVPQVTMGYERTAAVSIPVGTNSLQDANSTNDAYAVVGTFKVRYNPVFSSSNNAIEINQLFATGLAAQMLATNKNLANIFGKEVGHIYLKSKTN